MCCILHMPLRNLHSFPLEMRPNLQDISDEDASPFDKVFSQFFAGFVQVGFWIYDLYPNTTVHEYTFAMPRNHLGGHFIVFDDGC